MRRAVVLLVGPPLFFVSSIVDGGTGEYSTIYMYFYFRDVNFKIGSPLPAIKSKDYKLLIMFIVFLMFIDYAPKPCSWHTGQ